jgi:hypothetical protein
MRISLFEYAPSLFITLLGYSIRIGIDPAKISRICSMLSSKKVA